MPDIILWDTSVQIGDDVWLRDPSLLDAPRLAWSPVVPTRLVQQWSTYSVAVSQGGPVGPSGGIIFIPVYRPRRR